MNRLERVRQRVDEILRQQPDAEEGRSGFVHLYGVAAVGALLALKRGLNPELCSVAGMLHDIWSYKTGDPEDHAPLSAGEADRILQELGGFTDEERCIIGRAITHHSDKGAVDGPMDELLKDADVLQHYLYNTSAPVAASRQRRLSAVLSELVPRATEVPGVAGKTCRAFLVERSILNGSVMDLCHAFYLQTDDGQWHRFRVDCRGVSWTTVDSPEHPPIGGEGRWEFRVSPFEEYSVVGRVIRKATWRDPVRSSASADGAQEILVEAEVRIEFEDGYGLAFVGGWDDLYIDEISAR